MFLKNFKNIPDGSNAFPNHYLDRKGYPASDSAHILHSISKKRLNKNRAPTSTARNFRKSLKSCPIAPMLSQMKIIIMKPSQTYN